MRVTFVSNYINHHQIPFSQAMYSKLGKAYTFIQMEPMEQERIQMGWDSQQMNLPYVRCGYQEPEECQELIQNSDVVIWGGTEDETWLLPRLQEERLVIRYSERLYKTGQWKAISPRGLWKKYNDHTKYRNKPVYLLCAGAYVASDFHIVHAYPNKMLKWGYFPETKKYVVDHLMEGKAWKKGNRKVEILWAARFIDWKHPEMVVYVAEKLSKRCPDFHITMIGGGELQERIQEQIEKRALQDFITLVGTKTPEQVRAAMEEADIFLMTSDRQEGWGAVLNEAMNSGCAVVAQCMVGAAPYLIQQGENGFLYGPGQRDEMVRLVERCVRDAALRERLGRSAYETIAQVWNAETASERLLAILPELLAGKDLQWKWTEGPCSQAGWKGTKSL